MRLSNPIARVLLVALPLFASACTQRVSRDGPQPPPGYSGKWIPSGEIQLALRAAQGARWVDGTGAFGGGELTVVAPFSVTPNPITGLGPNALLSRHGDASKSVPLFATQGQDGDYWIALDSDADCADFLRRVGIEPSFGASGELSEVYRRSTGLAPKH